MCVCVCVHVRVRVCEITFLLLSLNRQGGEERGRKEENLQGREKVLAISKLREI